MKLLNIIRRYSHTLESYIEANNYQRSEAFHAIASAKSEVLTGHYDGEGFKNYQSKNSNSHFKQLISHPEIQLSGIGVGTYKGSLDNSDDLPQFNGVVDSLLGGINAVDTCRNFRGGRSEIIVGHSLRYLIETQGYKRNSFMVSSKAGYVRQNLPKEVKATEVVNDHCVHPLFLEAQLQRSLNSMGLNTIDVYYLNNFVQSQMNAIEPKLFQQRLVKAFQFLQKARSQGKIRFYGLSSWQAFRLLPTQKGYLNIQKVFRIAEKVGGVNHGFKFVQLPINVLMPEVFAQKYKQNQSFLDLSQQLKLNVVSNSPMLSGSLINIPMQSNLLKCINNGAKHLQLIRSIPSKALVCTLVGHKLNRHVKKNLQVLSVPTLDEQEWLSVFVPSNTSKPVIQEQESI